MKKGFCLLVCLFASSAQASFMYDVIGNATEDAAVDGKYDMSTGAGSVDAPVIETFLGLTPGSLDSISPSGNDVDEGSALRASIDVMVGDRVSFDWDFITEEVKDSPLFPAANLRDFAFYSLKLITMGEPPLLLADALDDNDGANGTESFIAAAEGTLEIGVGVVDVLDFEGNSFITASNFVLDRANTPEPVPEPVSIALLGLGLAGMGWSKWRKTA